MPKVKIIEPDEQIFKIVKDSIYEIKKLFPSRVVEHIGALAVPMCGRKEIDIMVISPNVSSDSITMNQTNYSAGPNIDGISYFRKFINNTEIGIQIVPENHPIIDIHRRIIKKLKNNPELKKRYSKFKYSLNSLTPDEYKSRKGAWIKENLLTPNTLISQLDATKLISDYHSSNIELIEIESGKHSVAFSYTFENKDLILRFNETDFGFKKDDPDVEEKLGKNLKTAIEDLSAQHEILLNGFKQIIVNMLGEDFNTALKERCDVVEKEAKRPKVKDLAKRLSQYIDGKTKFEFVINILTGVPERNWTDKHLRSGLDELQNLCVQFRRIESFSNFSTQGSSKPLAFITTDKKGNHQEFSSFTKHDLAADDDVQSAVNNIEDAIAKMPKEKQLAALTNLLTNLMDQTETEVLDDGKS